MGHKLTIYKSSWFLHLISFAAIVIASPLEDNDKPSAVTEPIGDHVPFKVDLDAIAKKIYDDQTVLYGSSKDDWKELHYKVYDLKGTPMAPEETLDLLEKLRDLYVNRQDEGSINRLKKVSELIEASEISAEKCNSENLLKLNKSINYNSAYKINVIPYLKYYNELQLTMCGSVTEAKLMEALSKFPKDDVNDVAMLHEKIFKTTTSVGDLDFLRASRDAVTGGILEFIEEVHEKFYEKLVGGKFGKTYFEPQYKPIKTASHICPSDEPLNKHVGANPVS